MCNEGFSRLEIQDIYFEENLKLSRILLYLEKLGNFIGNLVKLFYFFIFLRNSEKIVSLIILHLYRNQSTSQVNYISKIDYIYINFLFIQRLNEILTYSCGAISTPLRRHRALLRGRERRNLKNLAKKARPMNARR